VIGINTTSYFIVSSFCLAKVSHASAGLQPVLFKKAFYLISVLARFTEPRQRGYVPLLTMQLEGNPPLSSKAGALLPTRHSELKINVVKDAMPNKTTQIRYTQRSILRSGCCV